MAGLDLVDRNLRQRFLPFVINPKNKINSTKATGLSNPQTGQNIDAQTKMQFFSFNSVGKSSIITGTGQKQVQTYEWVEEYGRYKSKYVDYNIEETNSLKINIVPEIKYLQDCKDIGFNTQNKIKCFDDLLNAIPAIQIREYTQDTRLDLLLSLLDYFKKGYETGSEVGNLTGAQMNALEHLLLFDCKNISTSKYWKKILEAAKDKFFNNNTIGYKDSVDKKMLIDFCYQMYYRMLTTTSTNTYVLPFTAENIYKGNGYEGWNTDFGIASGGLLSKLGALGNFISPNINLTTTPIWKGCKGGEGINLEMTVNLFNDTVEHAVNNFIFINTIIPQNLPTQYTVLQQPPSLYDIKIEGFSRLFMCAGNFEVNYKGVMRDPCTNIDELTNREEDFFNKLAKHVNTNILDYDKDDEFSFLYNLVKNNQIKIPDIYELKLQFKSLLPNTFNNFLFQFAMNGNITEDTPITQDSWVENTGVPDAIKDWFGTKEGPGRIKDAIDYVNAKTEGFMNITDKEDRITQLMIDKQNVQDETIQTQNGEITISKEEKQKSIEQEIERLQTYDSLKEIENRGIEQQTQSS